MLIWSVGKGVAQKVQGSDYGLLTWAVSLTCLWIISDIWFFNALFFKKDEKNESVQHKSIENKVYVKTIDNMSHGTQAKLVDMPVQIKKTDPVKQSETRMNNNVYSESINEDNLYLQATQEVDEGNQDKALWAKCMALCEGGENKAKYKYIKERVDRLRQDKRKEIEEKKQENERAKVIEQQKKLEEEKIRKQEFERAKILKEQQRLEEEIIKKQEIKRAKALDKQKRQEEENQLKQILSENNYIFYKKKYGPYVVKQKGEDKAQIFSSDQEFKKFVNELMQKTN
jgi:hypothetical protein